MDHFNEQYLLFSIRSILSPVVQMVRLFFQCLAIYNNENMPLSTIFLPKVALNVSKNSRNSTKLPVFCQNFPSFTKSGHTGSLTFSCLFISIEYELAQLSQKCIYLPTYLPTTILRKSE